MTNAVSDFDFLIAKHNSSGMSSLQIIAAPILSAAISRIKCAGTLCRNTGILFPSPNPSIFKDFAALSTSPHTLYDLYDHTGVAFVAYGLYELQHGTVPPVCGTEQFLFADT